jgi:hypothetical protein
MKHQYSPTGPTLGSYKGELPFQARPPLLYALVASESHGSPAYVVYKVGGDPVDHQFFSEPHKEIPHGYMCAYIPDSNNPVHSVQRAAGGVSKADADKQAWLAAYATGLSHPIYKDINRAIIYAPRSSHAYIQQNYLDITTHITKKSV